jgi:glutathione/glutaredoxin type arsenate reductase
VPWRGRWVPAAAAKALWAEAIGTFVMVFIGTGAVMVNTISQGAVTHLGISGVFGAIVAALIYSLGHISGAHFNPAVTLAFWTAGYFPRRRVLPYIGAQCGGAMVASGLLWASLGDIGTLGATLPLNNNWMQALVLETVLTFVLMLVIFGSGLDARAPIGFAGLAIGLTVGVEAAVMGPITGASMNPARSLGPALIGGNLQHLWLYWVAPILGAQLAVLAYGQLSDNFQDLNPIQLEAVAMKRIMFVCKKNSSRSQMAEGFAQKLGAGQVSVSSSGLEASSVNPGAIAAMDAVGIDIRGQTSNALAEFRPEDFDVVISLCGCGVNLPPEWVMRPVFADWQLDDPAEQPEIFPRVRDEVRVNVEKLLQSLAVAQH